MTRFAVLGASAAGTNVVRKLRELNPEAEIILISEDDAIYSRCILYHKLEGIRDLEGMNFVGPDFIERMGCTWIKGVRVVGLEVEQNRVLLSDGQKVAYDQLCICTGSHTNYPPIPGLKEAKNVVGFRNYADVLEVEKWLPKAQNILIMGAGLVGVDVMTGLLDHGKNIYICARRNHMLPDQLDDYAASVYEKKYADAGVNFRFGRSAGELILDEEGICRKVIMTDGEELPMDLIINCAGVKANVEFLADTPVECDRKGLIFDEYGRTSVPNIYGAGDVSGKSPIWPAAVKEGMIAAYNMSGIKRTKDDFFASRSTMNFFRLPTMSLGNVNKYDETYTEEIFKDEEKQIYRKVVHKDGIITGAILQGDLSYCGVLTQLIRRKIDITRVKKPLFQIDYSDFFHQNERYEFLYEDA